MRVFLLCLTLVACGGGAEAGDAPLSEAELRSEIMAEAERIDSCEVVDDCEEKSFDCSALYVGADADQTRIDELLSEFHSRFGPVGCDASCQCGLLRCEQNECVTEPGDCMNTPPDAMTVCL